jgi:hypothetical protein
VRRMPPRRANSVAVCLCVGCLVGYKIYTGIGLGRYSAM